MWLRAPLAQNKRQHISVLEDGLVTGRTLGIQEPTRVSAVKTRCRHAKHSCCLGKQNRAQAATCSRTEPRDSHPRDQNRAVWRSFSLGTQNRHESSRAREPSNVTRTLGPERACGRRDICVRSRTSSEERTCLIEDSGASLYEYIRDGLRNSTTQRTDWEERARDKTGWATDQYWAESPAPQQRSETLAQRCNRSGPARRRRASTNEWNVRHKRRSAQP